MYPPNCLDFLKDIRDTEGHLDVTGVHLEEERRPGLGYLLFAIIVRLVFVRDANLELPKYRYRGRRSRSRSLSRSPVRHRARRYSRSPVNSRSPVDRYRRSPSADRRKSPSRSRSRSESRSSRDSQSPKQGSKDKSRSSSASPPGKAGLVSYGDGSPDSG